MANFKQDILEAVEDEVIEAVVITGIIYEYFSGRADCRNTDSLKAVIKKAITWEQAAPLLDYSYDSGYGGMDCHDVLVYTAENVYYIHEYDGSTSVHCVPRNPPVITTGDSQLT